MTYVLQCVECGQWDFTKHFDEQFLCADCTATDFCLECDNPMFECECLNFCQHCSNEEEDCSCGCCEDCGAIIPECRCDPDYANDPYDDDDWGDGAPCTECIEDEIDRKVVLMKHRRL